MAQNHELSLLHLSDIHIKKAEIESGQDVDEDIRAKLVEDLAHGVRGTAGVDAILVTGDIAYAAEGEEYGAAHEWLKQLCGVVKCEPRHVWMVPGNHDVQQSVVRKSLQRPIG
jgi:3',5'-cyclic AMP phosphodiesterase CpdA